MFTKHMKHWLATVAMLLCSLVASAYDFEVDGIRYNILSATDLTVEVTASNTEYSGDIVIPATVAHEGNTYSVTSIGYRAFYECENIKTIQIPQSVKSIGLQAFAFCSSLASIEIPDGIKVIAYGTFMSCNNLSSISIPNSVVFIGANAFDDTAWYENQPDGIVYIGNVLYDVKGETQTYTSISVKEGTTCIVDGAFSSCTELVSISIPETVSFMGNDVFNKTSPWYENLPEGLIYIGNVLYKYKGELPAGTSITVKDGTTAIAGGAFYGCSNLTAINLPETIISLGERSFSGCSGLTSIYIPKNVEWIEIWAFEDCSNLVSITVHEENTNYDSRNKCNAVIETANNRLILGCGNTVFPSELKSIGIGAFYGCNNLTSVVIPMGVDVIEVGAFANCKELTSVTIPKSVHLIDWFAFNLCEGLTSIVCKAITPPMISETFYGVDKSIPVYVPAGSVNVYKAAEYWNEFANIVGMREVLASGTCGTNQTWTLYTDGELIIEGTGAMNNYSLTDEVPWYGYETSIKTVTIKEGVTSIGDYAFFGCSNLTSIDIPKGVESIGEYAFCACNLIRITISTSVTSIGEAAFANNPNLAEIMVEQGNAHYDSRNNCNAIIETANGLLVAGCAATLIPEGVTAIGYGAFAGTKGLSSIFIPKNVNTIRANAFQCCDNLTEVNCAENSQLTSIGGYAFSQCRSLTSINIPEGVTSIGAHAFMLCTSLTSIVIPESVTEIGGQAFDRTGLSSITCKAITPPSNDYGIEAFSGVDKSIPVYVPAESVEAYKAAEYWKEFTNIQPIPTTDIASGTCGDNLTWRLTEEYELVIEGAGEMYNYFTGEERAPWYEYRESIKSITMKEGITSIGDGAFLECSNVTYINIPEGVTSIGDYAFSDCSSLTSITIPEGVTSIGNYAFEECSSLTSVTIPKESQLAVIGESAFENCENLTNINFPESVIEIKDFAFCNCYKIESIFIPKNVSKIGMCALGCRKNLNRISVDANNKTYDSRNDCNAVIETATNRIIAGCKTTVISPTVTSIGEGFIAGFYGITSFSIPEGVTTIEKYAFTSCRDLTSINIPQSIDSIGHQAFFSCDNISTLYINDIEDWCGIDFNDYFSNPFSHNWGWDTDKSLYLNGVLTTTLAIPNTITTIKPYAFAGFSNITAIAIPESVTSIGAQAFADCNGLTNIIIPKNVTSIDEMAFRDCSGLTSIICSAVTPPSIGDYAFRGVNKSIPIYVPVGSVDAYKEAEYWMEFDNILPIKESVESNITLVDGVDFEQESAEEYTGITYTRNFRNTNWQALYVPFEIPLTDEFLADFEVAYIYDARQYDRDDDGVKDEIFIEAFKKKGGVLEANYPYLIRAKEAGEKTITVNDAILYATEENSYDCSSMFDTYTFTGTYHRMPANELTGCYALSGGVWQPVADDASLGAFRFYLKIETRSGEPVVNKARSIRMRIIDEDGNEEDGATRIDDAGLSVDNIETIIYDLQGRRITYTDNLKGVYIVNGKKVVF